MQAPEIVRAWRDSLVCARQIAAATGRRVVFFCAFGERSAMAVAAAKSAGLVNTAHIEGGIDAWKKVGWAGGDGVSIVPAG